MAAVSGNKASLMLNHTLDYESTRSYNLTVVVKVGASTAAASLKYLFCQMQPTIMSALSSEIHNVNVKLLGF